MHGRALLMTPLFCLMLRDIRFLFVKKLSRWLALLNRFDYTLRDFAVLTGTLVSCCPAVSFGWAHFKVFERVKFRELVVNNKDFDDSIKFPLALARDLTLSKWWTFCKGEGHDFYSNSHKEIIKFLTLEFNRGASFSYLNCLRSAISYIVGNEFSNTLEIKRLFKGILRRRPPSRKYDSIWNPKIELRLM
ncbi:hypothetical protein PPYR_15642 [Photinus pyralis]|uniref:Uncharacterized protein n=1 Tax=Photinus pyralis TaxID=7054 RepID=A0A5N3ZYA0_PHOPY|nr:hypothetical protein PPYR_15642 [Photinus pyralis]